MPLSIKGGRSQRQGCSSPAIQLTVLLPCATTRSIQISKMSKASAVSWCVVVSRSVGVEGRVRNIHVPFSPPYAFGHSIPRQPQFRNKRPISRPLLLTVQLVSARRHRHRIRFCSEASVPWYRCVHLLRGTGVAVYVHTDPSSALERPLQISHSGFRWAVRLSAGTFAPVAVGRCSKFPKAPGCCWNRTMVGRCQRR